MQSALRLDFEPAALPGREKQQRVLRDFLAKHVQARANGGSLYVSGRPGTGKTASVDHVVHSMFGQRLEGDGRAVTVTATAAAASLSTPPAAKSSVKKKLLASASSVLDQPAPTVMYINAMRLPKPSDLYRRLLAIARGLGAAAEQTMPPPHASMTLLQELLCPAANAASASPSSSRAASGGMYLIVVDEVDALLKGPSASVLYELLEWPHRVASRVAVICISNEINLLEQKLPGLERRNAVPQGLGFTTYSAPELLKIARGRCEAVERRQREAMKELAAAQATAPPSLAAHSDRAEAAAGASDASAASASLAASSTLAAASPSKRISRSAAAAALCASPAAPAAPASPVAVRGRKRKTTALPTPAPAAAVKESPEPIVATLVAPLCVRVDTPSSMDTTEIGESVASPVAAPAGDADPCVTPKKARRGSVAPSPAASPSAASAAEACASPLASPSSSASALRSPASAATAASPSTSGAADASAAASSLFSSDALEWLCKNVAGPGGGDLRKVLKTMSTCLDRLLDMHSAAATESGTASSSNQDPAAEPPQQVSFSLMRSVLPPSMGGALEQQTMLRNLPVQQKVVLVVGALLRELHGRDQLHAFPKLYTCFCAHFELHPAKGAEYDDLLQSLGSSLIEIVPPRRTNSGGGNRGPRAAPGSGSSAGARRSSSTQSGTALCGILVRVSVDTLRSVWHEDALMQRLLSKGVALVNSILAANQIAAARNHEDYRQRDLETP